MQLSLHEMFGTRTSFHKMSAGLVLTLLFCLLSVFSSAHPTIDKHLLTLGPKDFVSIIPFNASIPTNSKSRNVVDSHYKLWEASRPNVDRSIRNREQGKRSPPVDVKSAFHLAFTLTENAVNALDKVC